MGADDLLLRASNEGLRRPRVARAKKIIRLHPSSLGFRRRPIQFSVPAAVEAGEAVAGFASGILHGYKGDGGVVKRARGLVVQKVHFGHHGNRSDVPRWGRLFFAGNLLLRLTPFACGLVCLDAGIVWGVIGDIHGSAASRFGTGQVFVL